MVSPVLFLIFNRMSTTTQVFETIRKAKPPKLYVAADGPRTSKPEEKQLCDQVRTFVLSSIDWPCEVKVLFREENLGCKYAVSSAIDWFFSHEFEGIILEDDVLPLPSFFQFCDEMLERYRTEPSIGIITGNNLISTYFSSDTSYFISHYPNIWGWATWKRVWNHYDVEMNEWPVWKKTNSLNELADNTPFFKAYWVDQIDAIYNGKMATWDFQLFFNCWKLNVNCVVPKNNLTGNLGFGELATHTTGATPLCVLESTPEELEFPLTHPMSLRRETRADRLINKRVFNIGLGTTIKWKLRRVPLIGDVLSSIKKGILKLKNTRR
jgi:hypothetical protein